MSCQKDSFHLKMEIFNERLVAFESKAFHFTSVSGAMKDRNEDLTHSSKVSKPGPENTLGQGLREQR